MTLRACLLAAAVAAALAAPARAQAPSGDAAPAPAWLVAEVTITDMAPMREYAERVQPVLEAFGGAFVARGGRAVALEGEAPAPSVVLIRFPSLAQAEAFWASPAYQEIIGLRHQGSRSRIFLTEGLAE